MRLYQIIKKLNRGESIESCLDARTCVGLFEKDTR